ncbi:hypothetical protein GOA63_16380 [Sinorhizobium meliloti]|uniref:hypothetical protein n=1 Tax=Rhizobium meliloti TaxID=382 RepID=UPI001294A219|nr:hypothetical protein [Sinorhizobium meliloti]MDW9593783.1 hypothetical protein [Sinorhizobium meliloti]MDX0188855.1 hypothetical protein [Sinorhizobium meliloti]MQV10091.1 hypothetical protein [Sinorhizobium meliloti]MQV59227.1 hypothetical protein [Sinorhizobium meliloti]
MTSSHDYEYSEWGGDGPDYDPNAIEADRGLALRKWVTHPGADFLNRLCPFGHREDFPDFAWLEYPEPAALIDALKYGFNAVQDYYQAMYLDRVLGGGATDEEQRVLHVVMRKTFQFGKLCEALTLGVFVDGACSRDGSLQRSHTYGFIVAPPTGLNKPRTVRALKGLIAKRLIDRVKSNWSPRSNVVSYVYCPLPMEEAVEMMLSYAQAELAKTHPRRAFEICRALANEISERCGEFFSAADEERNEATAKRASALAKQNERKAAKPCAQEPSLQLVATAAEVQHPDTRQIGGCSRFDRSLRRERAILSGDKSSFSAARNTSVK